MHLPQIEHWKTVKCIIQYLSGTMSHGIYLYTKNTPDLHAFPNADWKENKMTIDLHGLLLSRSASYRVIIKEANWLLIVGFYTGLSIKPFVREYNRIDPRENKNSALRMQIS